MQIKEMYVSINNAERIFEIIKDALNECNDTQIFVADDLIDDLIDEFRKNGVKHHVFYFNGGKCFHYDHDSDGFGGETWYGYHRDTFFSPLISSASFISNCRGYFQLVEFPNGKHPSQYTHYCVGFKKLLLIEVDTSKNNS